MEMFISHLRVAYKGFCMRSNIKYSQQQLKDFEASIWESFNSDLLTRTERDVLKNLLILISQGEDHPTQRHIANKSKCSLKTVSNAIRKAKEIGILQVKQLYKKVGCLARKITCHYSLVFLKELPQAIFLNKRKITLSSKTEIYKNRENEVIHRHKSVSWYQTYIQRCILEEQGYKSAQE